MELISPVLVEVELSLFPLEHNFHIRRPLISRVIFSQVPLFQLAMCHEFVKHELLALALELAEAVAQWSYLLESL